MGSARVIGGTTHARMGYPSMHPLKRYAQPGAGKPFNRLNPFPRQGRKSVQSIGKNLTPQRPIPNIAR